MIDTKNLNLPEAVSAGFLVHANPIVMDAIIKDPVAMITRGLWMAEILARMQHAEIYCHPALVDEFSGLIQIEHSRNKRGELGADELHLTALLVVCRITDNCIDAFCADKVRARSIESDLYDAKSLDMTAIFMREGNTPLNIDTKVLMMFQRGEPVGKINLVSMLSTGA